MSQEEERLLGIPIISMPPIPREPFKSDEDHQRALATSQAPESGHPGSDIFIPEHLLVDVFQALVNNQHAVGMGVLHDRDMSWQEARDYLAERGAFNPESVRRLHIDYVNGRPIKLKPLERVEGGWQFNSRLYNRDAATEPAEEVVNEVLAWEGDREEAPANVVSTFAYVLDWLERERSYQEQKFDYKSEAARTRQYGIDHVWERQLANYLHRAKVLGLDTLNGRQAAAKFAATAVALLENIVEAFGKLPAPGVPSGELGEDGSWVFEWADPDGE